jgi:diguanylate cyclase (GGDEF)-like protein
MLRRKAADDDAAGARLPNADPLTGLPGRSQILSWLTDAASQSQATSQRVALFMVGVGNLRDVNDTYGPEVGDRILAEVAQRLTKLVGNAGAVGRYNAAELAAVVNGVGTAERTHDIAVELLAALDEPYVNAGVEIPVFSQIGGALSDPGHANNRAWLDDAHHALVEAREQGLGSVVVHDEATRNRIDTQITDERVRLAFENEEFVVVFQPIVRPQDGDVVGFEALLRWLDPSSGTGLISPGQFLPLLEKNGLITPVGTWTLSKAIRQINDWNAARADRDPFFVSVNLGAKQMAQSNFADTVAQTLDEISFKPELLSLDVTPDALRYNKSATWSALRGLSALGIRIALDDFGVGDSSMAYLRELQVDLLRIDRMFLDGLGKTPEDTAIVRHLIGIGRDLEILTLAEGVEREEQVRDLQSLGCPLAQGWYFGRPALPAEIESTLLG